MTSNVVLKKLGLDSAELIDAMFAIALTLLGLVGFRYAFGQHQYMVVGTVAALVGALVALVIIRFKLPGLVALALSAVVFLIVGAVVAINDQTIARFLPTPSGFTGLIDGIMSGWRKLLTTLPPSGSLGNLLAVPFLCGYVSALCSTLLARRSKLLGTLLVWPGLVVALTVLFGDRKPFSLIVQGAVFGTVAIGWLAIRRSRERTAMIRAAGRKRMLGGLVMLALIGGSSLAVGPLLPFAKARPRYVFDRLNPPFDPRQFGSPLNGYDRYLTGDLKDKVLFTVSGAVVEQGQKVARVRLATMDDYNGVVWEVDPKAGSASYQFQRVGEKVPTSAKGPGVSLNVKVGALPGVWVPNQGVVTGISWSTKGERGTAQRQAFRLNTETQSAADPVQGGLAPDDGYVVKGVLSAVPTDELLKLQSIPESLPVKVDAPVPDALSTRSGEVVKGRSTAFDAAQSISDWFHKNGYYTTGNKEAGEGPLQPGHSAARLAAFMEDDAPLGSSEQFAAAMALMARKAGLPARVVMGFQFPVSGTAPVEVKGQMVDAWVEIPFYDKNTSTTSWRVFDPTPRDKTNKPPIQNTKQPRPKFESQDVPPPPLPPPPVDVLDLQTGKDKPTPAVKKDPEKKKGKPSSHVVLYAVGAGVGTPLVVGTCFAGTVLLLKRHRRRRRQQAAVASNRVAGGWAEYVDRARDQGLPVPSRSTRREAALMIGADPGLALAHDADEAVFGPADPHSDAISSYWERVAVATRELRSGLSIVGRAKASLSLTSLKAQK